MSNKVIGVGSYGCVHNPPLKCKHLKQFNKDYVSKTLLREDADLEKRHIQFIKKIDPQLKYHLRTVTECVPENNNNNRRILQNCDIFYKNNRLKTLIMENGGVDLEVYSKSIDSNTKAMFFWLQVLKVIKTIKLYLVNGVIHNDLKHGNILFNDKTQKMSVIDFGLMHTNQLKKNAAKNFALHKVRNLLNLNKNENVILNEIFIYWPLENEYIEKKKFIVFIEKTPFYKHKHYIESIVKELEHIYFLKNENLKIKALEKDEKIALFFQLTNNICIDTPFTIYDILNDYLNNIYITQEEYKQAPNKHKYYKQFLKKHLDTFDIYSLGVHLIECLKIQQRHLDQHVKNDLYELFYRMITPIVKNRITIDNLLENYVFIMNKHIGKHHLNTLNDDFILQNNPKNNIHIKKKRITTKAIKKYIKMIYKTAKNKTFKKKK